MKNYTKWEIIAKCPKCDYLTDEAYNLKDMDSDLSKEVCGGCGHYGMEPTIGRAEIIEISKVSVRYDWKEKTNR